MVKNISKIILVLIFIACESSNQYNLNFHTKRIDLSGEPEVLTGERLAVSDSLFTPSKLAVFSNGKGDLFAVISDISKQPPIHYVNLTEDRYITGIGRSGKGPGEFVSAGSVYYEKATNRAVVIDPMQQRITYINLNQPEDSLKNLYQNEPLVLNLEFPGLPFDILKLHNNRYAAIGPMRVSSSQKFAFIDSSGKQVGAIGSIPEYETIKLPPPKQHLLWRAYGTVNDTGTRFVAAYYNMDLLEIYNTDGERIEAIRGPEFSPLMVDARDGNPQLSREHTRSGYIAVTAQNGYIYGLYSGRKRDHPQRNMAKNVLVLDWNGNFITSYKLDRNVFEMAVSPSGEILYAIINEKDSAEPGLYRYELP